MNGHTTCVRLLLDELDSADLVDAADSQGQWVILFCFLFFPVFPHLFQIVQPVISFSRTSSDSCLQDSSDASGGGGSRRFRVATAGEGSQRQRGQ